MNIGTERAVADIVLLRCHPVFGLFVTPEVCRIVTLPRFVGINILAVNGYLPDKSRCKIFIGICLKCKYVKSVFALNNADFAFIFPCVIRNLRAVYIKRKFIVAVNFNKGCAVVFGKEFLAHMHAAVVNGPDILCVFNIKNVLAVFQKCVASANPHCL